MIHELRTYTLARGTGGVRELERRFGNNLEIRLKYSKLGGLSGRGTAEARGAVPGGRLLDRRGRHGNQSHLSPGAVQRLGPP